MVLVMLEGKNVNLRIIEKKDLQLVGEWFNDPRHYGEYLALRQRSITDLEKRYDARSPEENSFFILKKDGDIIGEIMHFPIGDLMEIGYSVIPNERRKGYCTEAVKIMVDYLFLSKKIIRIQAHTDIRNRASEKVLEKSGFKKEGIIRKLSFIRGKWRDIALFGILREEWKEPRILTEKQLHNKSTPFQ